MSPLPAIFDQNSIRPGGRQVSNVGIIMNNPSAVVAMVVVQPVAFISAAMELPSRIKIFVDLVDSTQKTRSSMLH